MAQDPSGHRPDLVSDAIQTRSHFHAYGRRTAWTRYTSNVGVQALTVGATSAATDPNFTPTRTQTTFFDARGRVLHEITPEGTLSYNYTVRPHGRRTSLDETFWIDANEDGEQQPGEPETTTYDWTYDAANRLTDEVIDHWDDTLDQTESFTYDLTGNRTALGRDKGNDGTIDEAITCSYDANDRLIEEILDSLIDTDDTTTTYAYDHTQQTEKLVTRSISEDTQQTVSRQLFSFDLQGRIGTVINEDYTDGTLSSRERTSYQYDMRNYRVQSQVETGTALSAEIESQTWTQKSSVRFLTSHRNHTGYAQTLRETRTENGNTLTVDYTFGHDEIAQRKYGNDAEGNPVEETLVFGHDGHGSVRVLYDLASSALIERIATYGAVIAIHSGIGTVVGTNEAAFGSTRGYSGEQWDASLRMQNLRARPYGPQNGRFIGLDPFDGNMQDPQSFHKYAYVHGVPVQGVDPTGLRAISIGSALASFAITTAMGATQVYVNYRA